MTPRKSSKVKATDPAPHIGDGSDLEDDDEVQIEVRRDVSGLRHAAIVPRSLEFLDDDAFQALSTLQRLTAHLQSVAEEIDQAVDEARAAGAPWAAIGWSVGTSGEAARQRWR